MFLVLDSCHLSLALLLHVLLLLCLLSDGVWPTPLLSLHICFDLDDQDKLFSLL
jgi:hypothetical protein